MGLAFVKLETASSDEHGEPKATFLPEQEEIIAYIVPITQVSATF